MSQGFVLQSPRIFTGCNFQYRKGIYETIYGNACYVSGPGAKTAFDLDSQERIPMLLVGKKFLRKATSSDRPSKY